MNDYDLTQLIETDQGDFKMLVPLRYVPHYLLSNYEPFSSKIIRAFLGNGSMFVDIGTHLGYYCLLALSCKENVNVIGFEPVDINYGITRKNIQLNKFKNFRIYNFAASNESTRKKFLLSEAAGESGFYNNHLAPVIKEVEVETIIPDDILQGQKVDFIKIDVEGHEIKVLEGLKKTFAKNKFLRLLIEYNPNALKNGNTSGEKLLKALMGLGFTVYFVDEEKERLMLYDKKQKNWKALARLQYTNLLCVRNKDPKHILKQEMDFDGVTFCVIVEKSKTIEKKANKTNLLAELDFYKKLHILRQAPNAPEQIYLKLQETEKELEKIKSSKFWKILNLYKNPKKAFSHYSKKILENYLFKINLKPKTSMLTDKKDQNKLHLGCGGVVLDGWLNIDLDNSFSTEIYPLDLSQNFPFLDNQTSKIFTEHTIECFPKEIGLQFLKECYRVLKPCGIIRIGFSDFTKLLKAYYKKELGYKQRMLTDMKPLKTNTWDEFVADMLFSWDRRYYYTCVLLKEFMNMAGFKNIEVRKFGESKYGFTEDTRKLPDNTYIEAEK